MLARSALFACVWGQVNASLHIEKEYYFAVMMDRASGGPLIVASKEGGVDIEEVAEKHPEAIVRVRRGRLFAASQLTL